MGQGRNITLAWLALWSWQAAADDFASEQDYYGELPVVLSASRLSQPLSEAPNAMTVIDRKMIEASGLRDLTDLFKLVPGMYVGYYKGHQGFVSYHGSPDQYARRMQVMVDGRSVYLPPESMVDWAALPLTLDDIERIEVIRGPAAASHGANSTQGVISIITRDAGGMNGRRLAIARGNKGISDMIARFGNSSEDFDYRMTLAYNADHGYDNLLVPPNSIPVPVATAGGLINNSYDDSRARLLNYRAEFRPAEADRIEVQFGFNHDVRQVGWTDSPPNPVHDLVTNEGFVQLGWTRALAEAGEFRLRYSHIRHDQHETFPVIFFPQWVMQSVNVNRDDLEVQHTLPIFHSNRLVYGAAYRADRIDGRYGSLAPIAPASATLLQTGEWRLFAHDEWRATDALLLNLGGMYERDRMRRENLSPRVSLNYHVTPRHTLRAGVSLAYRTPSLMETNYPAVQPGELFVVSAQPLAGGLLPERMLSREIGYIGELPAWNASVDLRLYSDRLSEATYPASALVFANGVAVEYRGLEATLKYRLGESGNLTLNYAHQRASSNAAVLAAAGVKAMKSVCPGNLDSVSCSLPTNGISMLYAQALPGGLAFSAAYYLQSAMQPFDRGPVDHQPLQRRVDVRVAHAFGVGDGMKSDIALVVQNLFNQGYTDYVANSLNNRRAYISIGLNW